MEYQIFLSVSPEGLWSATMRGGKAGEVSDSPGEAVTTLLENAGIETVTGAMVTEDAPLENPYILSGAEIERTLQIMRIR